MTERRLDRLEEASTQQITAVVKGIVDDSTVLLTDGQRAYPEVASNLRAPHEAVVVSGAFRVRGTYHVQDVNAQHSMLKTFLDRSLRGVATHRLPHDLECFYLMMNRKLHSGTGMFAALLSNETRFFRISWCYVPSWIYCRVTSKEVDCIFVWLRGTAK